MKNRKHEPLFTSGSSIIQQFFLTLMKFRKTANLDSVVITDSMWFNMLVSIMDRIRNECYISDESSKDGAVAYPIENIVKDGEKTATYPSGCITIDPRATIDDIIDSGVIINIADPFTMPELTELVKVDAVDQTNAEFIDMVYQYTMQTFSSGRYTIYTNIILMYTLMHIFNDEVLDNYYALVGMATPNIDCTSTLLMRNVALNTLLRSLAECWSVKLPPSLYQRFEEVVDCEDCEDIEALVKLKVSCNYRTEDFTMDGMDIFSCNVIPTHIAIGVAYPE